MTTPPYTVHEARYAKGMMLVRAPGNDGLKTRAARLLEALRFRYTNREHGYVGSPSKVRRFEQLLRDGWDANFFTNKLTPPEQPEPAAAHGYGPGWGSCSDCGQDLESGDGLCDGCSMLAAAREREQAKRARRVHRVIEGVDYSPFVIRFRLADGRTRRWVRWSPSVGIWVREELEHELWARGLRPEHLKERSCTITRRAS